MNSRLRAECQLILRVLFRQPAFWIPTVILPAMLYSFFGAQAGGGLWAANAMASFCIFAVLGVGFFQFGVGTAQDRESPFEAWQRSLPGGITLQWVARIIAALIFVALAVLLVIVVAILLNGIQLDTRAWMRLIFVCLISVIPTTLMGIALGSVCSARTAVPLATLIYLPLAYLGGLWLPPMVMPPVINAISEWAPTRAMGELSWSAVNGTPWASSHVLLLIAWSVAAAAFVIVAQLRLRVMAEK